MIQNNAVSGQILEKTKGTIETYLRKSEQLGVVDSNTQMMIHSFDKYTIIM